MSKYLIHFILFWLCTLVHAQINADLSSSVNSNNNIDLKMIGYTQAHYEMCKSLAKKFDDQVMVYYYGEMLKMNKSEHQVNSVRYDEVQLEVIKSEYRKAFLILNKVNSASLHQLCLNRFDPVSRQHFQSKLEKLN